MGLAIFDIDKAITDKCPKEPTLLDIPDDLGADAKAEREKQNSKLMVIEKINWERSNRKCLMVIKERISEGIRDAIPECKDCCWVLGDSVRDHILKMSNVAARLKPLDLAINDGFLIYLIFNKLLKEFKPFEVNYNSMNNKWTLKKFITMCV
jgi:hypothetical protein